MQVLKMEDVLVLIVLI